MIKMYLDIETSGLSIKNDKITIIGLLVNGQFEQFIEGLNLIPYYVDEFIMLHEPDEVVGYNSNKFDIPFMEEFGVETLTNLKQTDLMHQCHNLGIKGGLKATETQLDITRKYEVLNFFQQKALWAKWINNQDRIALDRLLKYNEEDVMNLPLVETKLKEKLDKQEEAHQKFKRAYFKKLGIEE